MNGDWHELTFKDFWNFKKEEEKFWRETFTNVENGLTTL